MRALLRAELAAMIAAADLVIVNGGLGPTIDDLTAEVLAAVAGVPLTRNIRRRWRTCGSGAANATCNSMPPT